jgi:hypothetical protein
VHHGRAQQVAAGGDAFGLLQHQAVVIALAHERADRGGAFGSLNVRSSPIATELLRGSKTTRGANNRSAGRFAGNLFPRVRLGTSTLNSFCQLL